MVIRERNAEESRQRILASAEKIFASKGLDGARVDEIAAAAQINKRMIYHYFDSKDNLFTAVLLHNYQRILNDSEVAASLSGTVIEKVKQVIRHYFYFLAQNDNFVRLIQWETLLGSTHSHQVLPGLTQTILPRLKGILEEGIEKNIFRQDLDIRHLILSINAICFFYFSRGKAYDFLWDKEINKTALLEDQVNHLLNFTLNGILKEKQL